MCFYFQFCSVQFSSKVNSKVNRNRLRFKSSKKIVDGKASRGQWGADRYPSGKVRTCVQFSSYNLVHALIFALHAQSTFWNFLPKFQRSQNR